MAAWRSQNSIFRKTDGALCTEPACWAHARRKFFDLHQTNAA
ncbi:transposase [uncultured Nitrosomonas sp.]|nr:transposase [uncultured Nitrosomonas sp.]